jgi:indole-3-glycerol phosphate synthase
LRVATDLVKFVEAKEASLRALKKRTHWDPWPNPRPGFGEALARGRKARGLGVIAEYKRASPSLGDINLGLGPEDAARHYALADCLSVLTEEAWFKGSLGYLGRMAFAGKPLLRKDFIFDPLQIRETAETPASAVLLMVRLTPDRALLAELRAAAVEAGLEPVVEVFDRGELGLARDIGATLIQFNARDLGTLKVDAAKALALASQAPPLPGELYVAASGLSAPGDLARAAEGGFGAALIGTRLMRAADPGLELAALLGGLAGPQA